MYNLASHIFDFFGSRDALNDVNVIEGKGFLQRFNETLASDLDSNELQKLETLISDVIVPQTMDARLLELRAKSMGLPFAFLDSDLMRHLLIYLVEIYRLKGTAAGYRVLFRMIGIDGEISLLSYYKDIGFDSPTTLDDPTRRFDSHQSAYVYYAITLKGTLPLTDELISMIKKVIRFNEPITAKLYSLTYNGMTISYSSAEGSFSDAFANAFD